MAVTLEKLTTEPYNLPLKSSLHWGKGHQLAALNHVLVKVYLSDGSTGVAEATPRPSIYGETPESVKAIIEREFAELLEGQPVGTLNDLHHADQRLTLIKNNNTAKGAVNMALWTAYAQSRQTTLARLLNVAQERVRLSFILGTGDLDTVLAEVQEVYAQGIRVLKVKAGKDFAVELELVRRIRQAYDDLDFYVDANECLDMQSGLDFLAQLRDMGALYCEEPLPVYQLEQRRNFRTQSPLPLIGDDSCLTSTDVERELAFDTFDIVNIKTARTGFSHSLAIMEQTQKHGKGVMVGSQASSLLGCLHAILFAAQRGIDHATEGSFFLKVSGDHSVSLKVEDGWVQTEQVESLLAQLQNHLA